MGTHPIFESDFDCLTESKMLSHVARSAARVSTARVAMVQTQVRYGGDAPTLTQAQLESAWVEYFDSDLCDYWYIRKGIREVLKYKCGPNEEAYDYVMQELGPSMADLGLKSPEELGLDVVVTEFE